MNDKWRKPAWQKRSNPAYNWPATAWSRHDCQIMYFGWLRKLLHTTIPLFSEDVTLCSLLLMWSTLRPLGIPQEELEQVHHQRLLANIASIHFSVLLCIAVPDNISFYATLLFSHSMHDCTCIRLLVWYLCCALLLKWLLDVPAQYLTPLWD